MGERVLVQILDCGDDLSHGFLDFRLTKSKKNPELSEEIDNIFSRVDIATQIMIKELNTS